MILRDYQERGLAEAFAVAADPGRRALWVAPTGSGKSHLMGAVLERLRAERIDAWLTTPSLEIIRGMIARAGVEIEGLSTETLHAEAWARHITTPVRLRNRLRDGKLALPTALLTDECFPGGTRIGGRRIDTLAPGDLVPSFDAENRPCWSRVVRVLRRSTSLLVKIRHAGGVLCCTPNHQVRVRAKNALLDHNAWCRADRLTNDDMVLCFIPHGHKTEEGGDLRTVRNQAGTEFRSILHPVPKHEESGVYGTDEPEVRIGEDEGSQPDARSCDEGEDADLKTGERMEPGGATRREWQEHDGPRDAYGLGAGLATGDCKDGQASRIGISVSLQGGHRKRDAQGGNRGRRFLALFSGSESAGCEERRSAHWSRVEGVSVLEPGRDGEFERLCQDGAVFDLEVEDTHTYFADNVGVHNCHHSVSENLVPQDLLELVGPACSLLGWTATPYRGTHEETLKLREFWGAPRTLLSIDEAVRRGYMALPAPRVVPILDDAGISIKAGEFDQDEAAERLAGLMDGLTALVAGLAPDGRYRRPTLVAVPSARTRKDLVERLAARGLGAIEVSAETPRAERDGAFAACRSGEACIVQIAVLAEGVDLPWLRVLVDARPLRSPVAWMQLLGRITRPTPEGEAPPEYVCICRNLERHAYLMGGNWPARRVATETQEGFARGGGGGEGPMPATAGGVLDRGVARDALRRKKRTKVRLLGGGVAELVHLGVHEGWTVKEVLVLGVPGEEEPRVYEREIHDRPPTPSPDAENPVAAEPRQRDWGRWRRAPLPSGGFDGWDRPTEDAALSPKQREWWEKSARGKGLASEGVDRRGFPVLPALFDTHETLALPDKRDPVKVQATKRSLVELMALVPPARYAVELDGKLRFFHVQHGEGKWRGWVFVKEQAGPTIFPVKDAFRKALILEAIAADVKSSLARYGRELGICGACGLPLTDETSRAEGIGPICRNKF